MFREGHYLEVIKASDDCLATAIVTIKEKTVEYKKKKITTNKWLDLQDWASLYHIIRKAIIRNYESRSLGKAETTERRKSTRHLEVTYKFEAVERPEDRTWLPTIRVSVSPLRKNSVVASNDKKTTSKDEKKVESRLAADENDGSNKMGQSTDNDSFLIENYSLEEYVPPALPSSTKSSANLKYVPSRKSALMRMRCSADENKYTPTAGKKDSSISNNCNTEISYIPNSISSLTKIIHEKYEPCGGSSLTSEISEVYVPSSKGARKNVEEYQPDFPSKTMKFDDSYVPSTTLHKSGKEGLRKRSRKSRETSSQKSETSSSSSSSSSRSIISKIAKREL